MENTDDNTVQNPYAAPQAELRPSANADSLTSATQPKYLRQGIIAGLQLGGIACLFFIGLRIFTWDKNSTLRGLFWYCLSALLFCLLLGTIIGGMVQLFSRIFSRSEHFDNRHEQTDSAEHEIF